MMPEKCTRLNNAELLVARTHNMITSDGHRRDYYDAYFMSVLSRTVAKQKQSSNLSLTGTERSSPTGRRRILTVCPSSLRT